MPEYVIPGWELPSLPIHGESKRFPVRRIWCVGRNYAAHIREMGYDPNREEPFFFAKPADAIVHDGGVFPYPPQTKNCHFELELVVCLGKGGKDVKVESALDHVYGYAVGLDMTRRDQQFAARDRGRPWEMGKGFDHGAPCSAIMPAARIGHPSRGKIRLTVNGETKQDSDLGAMIWKVPEMISYLSALVELAPGDIIYSGTPDGVGPIVKGDRMHGEIEKVGTLDVTVG